MLKKLLFGFKKPYILKTSSCKMNNVKAKVLLSEEALIIRQNDNLYKLMCDTIENVTLAEKLWCIRISLMYNNEKYALDFSNTKKARALYEKLIYCKVKTQLG